MCVYQATLVVKLWLIFSVECSCLRNIGLIKGKLSAKSKYNLDIYTYRLFIVVTVKTRPPTNA